jgi:hypothetical protein
MNEPAIEGFWRVRAELREEQVNNLLPAFTSQERVGQKRRKGTLHVLHGLAYQAFCISQVQQPANIADFAWSIAVGLAGDA